MHYERLGGKIERAIEVIRSFAEPFYVATSWGKDSVVVADLVFLAIENVPLYHVSQPDSDLVEENQAVADAFSVRNETIVVRSLKKSWRDGQKTPELVSGIRWIQAMLGTTRWIGGLRRGEKGGRQFRSDPIQGNSCQPICDWSVQDVFAYLAGRNLPVHSRYAMTGGGRWPRDRIRVCTFGGYRGTAGGRAEWEQEYYGDVLRRIAATR